MQGLWKNNLSGWNNKCVKRKKQTFNHFLNDSFKGIYKNSDKIRQNDNKQKKDFEYSRRNNKFELEETIQNFSYKVKYIQFKRQIRLSDKFIKRNCDFCEHNEFWQDSFIEKHTNTIYDKFQFLFEDLNKDFNIKNKNDIKNLSIEKIIEYSESFDKISRQQQNALYSIRYRKFCNLDVKSYHIKRYNNQHLKTWFFEKNKLEGCMKSSLLDFKFEYKIFKVIEINGIYYKVFDNKRVYFNKSKLESSWIFDEIVRETDTFIDMYYVEETYPEEGSGAIVFNGNKVPYKHIKRVRKNYSSEYSSGNRILRHRNNFILKKMLLNEDFETLSFVEKKKSWWDYY